jgi:hypothetical protein
LFPISTSTTTCSQVAEKAVSCKKNQVQKIRVQVEAGKAIASFSKEPIDGTSNLMQKKKKGIGLAKHHVTLSLADWRARIIRQRIVTIKSD